MQRDQIQIQQREIDSLRMQEKNLKHENSVLEYEKSNIFETSAKEVIITVNWR